MSTLHVNKLKAAVGTTVNVESGHTLHQPGSIIQIVRTTPINPRKPLIK